MAGQSHRTKWSFKAALLSGAAMLAAAVCAPVTSTIAAPLQDGQLQEIPAGAKLYLSSDTLIYDRDHGKIIAAGTVRINYGGYKMVAQRVTYDQVNGRMLASGKIEFVEPSGNRIYADTLDVTDDFANGFINTLRLETTDDTHLAAESAERIDSTYFVLHNGVYTACKPCADHPEKPPLWQVKAEKVIQNGETHTVRLEKARFELFGRPIAYLPALELPDHTVKRKSGFLFPTLSTAQNLGFGAHIPYYHVISPHMDVTFNTSIYTTQGLLLDAEFRQRLKNGQYSVRLAGIHQLDPGTFTAGTSDRLISNRALAWTKGEFKFNPRWSFGWDALLMTDNNFARTYSITDPNEPVHKNEAYLTGIGKRNHFDLHGYYFDVQDADPTNSAETQQAIVLPVLDYKYIAPKSVLGGELSFTTNFTSISRTNSDVNTVGTSNRFQGLAGYTSRLSAELQWRRTFVVPGGLLLTPLAALRGDLHYNNVNSPASLGYTYAGNFYTGSTASRSMATAGLEARYPISITTANSQHVFEPIAQLYVRPDEQLAGRLPNEDSQSFVFDATNLFERDKFSGYDRMEGGTRLNVGFRYTGSFTSGYRLNAIFGQSYHLAGQNSFATSDLVNVGANSGLETKVSDYVGMAGLDTPHGISVSASARFNKKNLKLRRTDAKLSLYNTIFDANFIYTQVAAQPDYGFATSNDEIQATGAVRIADHWKVFGGLTWDLNNAILSRRGVGISYDDECTVFSLAFSQVRDIADTNANDWEIGARLSFRTLGDIKVGDSKLNDYQ